MDNQAMAESVGYMETARRDASSEASTLISLKALDEANQRLDRLVGVLHDKLTIVLAETEPEGSTVSEVRSERSSLATQIFNQADAMHTTAWRLERLLARIDL